MLLVFIWSLWFGCLLAGGPSAGRRACRWRAGVLLGGAEQLGRRGRRQLVMREEHMLRNVERSSDELAGSSAAGAAADFDTADHLGAKACAVGQTGLREQCFLTEVTDVVFGHWSVVPTRKPAVAVYPQPSRTPVLSLRRAH